MIENRNESELEAHLRRVIKHSGNLSGLKSDRGNEKIGLRTVSRKCMTKYIKSNRLKSRRVKVLQIHSSDRLGVSGRQNCKTVDVC